MCDEKSEDPNVRPSHDRRIDFDHPRAAAEQAQLKERISNRPVPMAGWAPFGAASPSRDSIAARVAKELQEAQLSQAKAEAARRLAQADPLFLQLIDDLLTLGLINRY